MASSISMRQRYLYLHGNEEQMQINSLISKIASKDGECFLSRLSMLFLFKFLQLNEFDSLDQDGRVEAKWKRYM